MLEKRPPRGVFDARMRQVEDQLFRAEFSGEINPQPTDAWDIPDYHVGTSAKDVKIWVEQMAREASATIVSCGTNSRRASLADPLLRPPIRPDPAVFFEFPAMAPGRGETVRRESRSARR